MARIAGVNIPENKHIEISLTHIFGIGRKRAQDICDALSLEYSKKVSDLSEDELEKVRGEVAKYTLEGDLRREVSVNIKRLMQEQEKALKSLWEDKEWQKVKKQKG